MTKVTQEFLETLQKEYENGMAIKYLNKKYHTDTRYLFKKYGIPIKSKEEVKKWREKYRPGRLQLNFTFENITKESEAYITGFVFADGYTTNKQLGFKLKTLDGEFVKKIKDFFNKDISLRREKSCVGFVVSSALVLKNLKNLGMDGHKIENPRRVPQIEKSLLRHFIRGYFDGDGTIFVCKDRNKRYLKSNICSTNIEILQDFQEILRQEGIYSTINVERRKGKTLWCVDHYIESHFDMYRLFIRKKEDIRKFYDFIYKDATWFLPRKKAVFDSNMQLLDTGSTPIPS